MYDRGQRWETGGELFIQYVFIKSLFYVGDSFLFCLGDTAMDKEEKKNPRHHTAYIETGRCSVP